MKKKKKNKGGRPKRFMSKFFTISIQLSEKDLKKFEEEAHKKRLSKSRFGEFLLKFWLEHKDDDDWYEIVLEKKNKDVDQAG